MFHVCHVFLTASDRWCFGRCARHDGRSGLRSTHLLPRRDLVGERQLLPDADVGDLDEAFPAQYTRAFLILRQDDAEANGRECTLQTS